MNLPLVGSAIETEKFVELAGAGAAEAIHQS
jgi:hypothetical protein